MDIRRILYVRATDSYFTRGLLFEIIILRNFKKKESK